MYEYFSLRISSDNMCAYLTVLYDNLREKITTENIIDYLKSKNIVFGILEDEIKKNVENKSLISNLLVAKGECFDFDKDKVVQCSIDKCCSLIPCADEDGFINFNNIKKPVFVENGDVLGNVNLFPEMLKYKNIFGKSCTLSEDYFLPKLGNGVSYDKKTKKLYSEIDGYVNYSDNIIDVLPARVFENSLQSGTYEENIIVYADILSQLDIKTSKNIIVFGNVENTHIEAGENIVVYGNIEDESKNTLKSGSDIIAPVIKNVNLYCRKNIISNMIIKCVAKAGKSIFVNGAVCSGHYTVGERFAANELRNTDEDELMINVWEAWYNSENNIEEDAIRDMSECGIKLSELHEQYIKLEKSLNLLKNMNYNEGGNVGRANILRQVTIARAQVMHAIIENEKKYNSLVEKVYREKKKKPEIACSGKIFAGTCFRIGSASYTVPKNTENKIFYTSSENIFLYKQYRYK